MVEQLQEQTDHKWNGRIGCTRALRNLHRYKLNLNQQAQLHRLKNHR